MDLPQMELRLATEEQDEYVTEITYLSWGAPHVSREQYEERENLFRSTNFGQWMIDYVFVPQEDRDTIDVRGYLELFKRTCLVFPHDALDYYTLDAYSVASVFTPQQHRQKGYASAMLQAFIASRSLDDKNPFVVSNLYSDIGTKLYQQNGWDLTPSDEITFVIDDCEVSSPSTELHTIDSQAVLDDICDLDRKNMARTIQPGQVGFLLTSDCIEFYHVKHKYCGQHNHKMDVLPTKYGAYTLNDGEIVDYVMWTYNFESKTLDVLKYHAKEEMFLEMLHTMQSEAKEWGLQAIRLWPTKQMHLPTKVAALAKPRISGLAMLLVQGVGNKSQALEWIANEKYLYA